MTIDWITVTAQIINFLILVWLLKRFLYQPVINAMDRREQRISERLSQAQRREQEAEDEAQDYRQRREALEQQREDTLQQAEDEAEQRRQQLLDEARREVDELRHQWRDELKQEQHNFLAELKRRGARSVTAIADRALTDLADADLERQIISNFLQRLDELDEATRNTLADDNKEVRLRSSFALDDDTRRRIGDAVGNVLGQRLELQYEQTEELVCGIELVTEGRKLGWSVAQYMDSLEASMKAVLDGAPGSR